MKLRTHLWTSVVAGSALWLVTSSSAALAGAVIGGVLIDADHVMDQLWSIYHGAPYRYRREKVTPDEGRGAELSPTRPRSAIDWFRSRKLVRLPLIFHSYELLAIAILIAAVLRTPLVLGLVSGYALHIALDLVRHHHEFRSPAFYLLSYRMSVGFRRDRLIKPEYL